MDEGLNVREMAQGRLHQGRPIAVIDIGSNSVRLVVYERLCRSPTAIYNEKALCGLGKSVATTGMMEQGAVDQALRALRRFRALADQMCVEKIWVLATAAARDAANGKAFLDEAEDICRVPVELISGQKEARLSALGIVASVWKPDGIVGDMGGGSLELISVGHDNIGDGVTLPLGALRLADASGKSLKKAEKLVRDALDSVDLSAGNGKTFYAVGGTWRSLGRLHMRQRGYPLNVMHGYEIPARDAADFARLIEKTDPATLTSIEVVNTLRRPLLSYGALVLEHIVRVAKPARVVISANGVREGLLYSLLDEKERRTDPLLASAQELAQLRSRSPTHVRELVDWTDVLFARIDPDESDDERRLRHAACLLADIGWRAHPDYRGEQSLNIIAHAAFGGVDHPGRAFLALAVFFRHRGIGDEAEDELSPKLRMMVDERTLRRARILGGAMRVAYVISASMPGVLPRAPLQCEGGELVMHLEGELAALVGDRVFNRVKTLGKLLGMAPRVVA